MVDADYRMNMDAIKEEMDRIEVQNSKYKYRI